MIIQTKTTCLYWMGLNWLDFQSRSSFVMADLNKITFPFNQFGDLVPGITNWVDMTVDFPYKKLRILDGRYTKIDSINDKLFRGRIEWEVEIDIPGI